MTLFFLKWLRVVGVKGHQWSLWSMMGCCSGVLQPRAVNVDLQTDATLQVDISDALSERDKVKFTVHTKVGLSEDP